MLSFLDWGWCVRLVWLDSAKGWWSPSPHSGRAQTSLPTLLKAVPAEGSAPMHCLLLLSCQGAELCRCYTWPTKPTMSITWNLVGKGLLTTVSDSPWVWVAWWMPACIPVTLSLRGSVFHLSVNWSVTPVGNFIFYFLKWVPCKWWLIRPLMRKGAHGLVWNAALG